MPQEHRGGVPLLVQNRRHVRARIEQHTHVQDHVAVVRKKLYCLRLAVFRHIKTPLCQIADQPFFVVTHAEVNRHQVYLAADPPFLPGALLLSGSGSSPDKSGQCRHRHCDNDSGSYTHTARSRLHIAFRSPLVGCCSLIPELSERRIEVDRFPIRPKPPRGARFRASDQLSTVKVSVERAKEVFSLTLVIHGPLWDTSGNSLRVFDHHFSGLTIRGVQTAPAIAWVLVVMASVFEVFQWGLWLWPLSSRMSAQHFGPGRSRATRSGRSC